MIHSEYKALQNDLALVTCIQSLLPKNAIERVENVKSLLQSPISSVQTSPKLEASGRPKQAQPLLFVEWFKMGFSDSRGMGFVNRSVQCLPSHPYPPKLKEVPMILP